MSPQRATLLVGFANLLGRITGLAREVAFSAVFGAGMVTDAFNAAFRISQLLRELLAEGSLQNAFVPAFLEVSERRGQEDAWKLASAALGVLMLVLGGVTLSFFLGAPFWVRLVADGFVDSPDKYALTISLTRWLSPFLAGLSLAGLFAGMLNARGKFFLPAISQNVLNLLVLGACLIGPSWEEWTGKPAILAVALATTLSGFAQLGLLVPSLWNEGFRFRPSLRGHPELGRMLRAFGPALIGISTVQVNLLIESQWAASYGNDGPVSWLNLSFRLVQIPLAVFAGSVATASLASLSLAEAKQDRKSFAETLGKAIRLNNFLVLPCAVAFVCLPVPLTRFCFERGAFTPDATAGTAAMLQMYGLAAMGICFHRIALPVYYSMNQPTLPARLSLVAMAAKIPVILLLTRVFGMGVEALPLSHALTVGGEALALYAGLLPRLEGQSMLQPHLKMGVAAAGLALILRTFSDSVPVVLLCAVGGLAYLGMGWALGLVDPRELLPRRRGFPPFVDAETAQGLTAMTAGACWDGERFGVGTEAWRPLATKGSLRLQKEMGEISGEKVEGPVSMVIRIGQGPPALRGIEVGGRVWFAEGEHWTEGPCGGPRIPVEPS